MSNKRSIRLKEFPSNLIRVHTPSNNYMEKSPRLQKGKAYFQRTSIDGFIETHLNYKAKKKVIIIGDSFIENIFVDESKRISSQLEELFLSSKNKLKVYNAGVSGATGLGLLNLVMNKIIPLKPDLIIYTQPSCDFSSLIYKNGYYNDSKFFSNLSPQIGNEKTFYETIEANIYQLENNINILSYICKLYKMPLCIATCCSNSSKRQLKMMNDTIRNGIGFDIIDLDNLVPRIDDYFYDKQHLTELGSKIIADIFHNYIRSKLPIEENTELIIKELVFNSKLGKLISNIINTEHENNSTLLRVENTSNVNMEINISIKNKESNMNETLTINIPENKEIELSLYIENGIKDFNIEISHTSKAEMINYLNILESRVYSIS